MRLNCSQDTRGCFGFWILAGKVEQPGGRAGKLNLGRLGRELICRGGRLVKLAPPAIHIVQLAASGAGQRNNGHLRLRAVRALEGIIAHPHLVRRQFLPAGGE